MNAKQLMKAGLGVVLGLSWMLIATPQTTAEVILNETLNVTKGCSGGCVDVWQVDCKDPGTGDVAVFGRDTDFPFSSIRFTILGYKGSKTLVGQADQDRGTNQASIFRPGKNPVFAAPGAISALVLVARESLPTDPTAYEVEFFCDLTNGLEGDDPVVTLLQDQ